VTARCGRWFSTASEGCDLGGVHGVELGCEIDELVGRQRDEVGENDFRNRLTAR
jgi:hypothetical protein